MSPFWEDDDHGQARLVVFDPHPLRLDANKFSTRVSEPEPGYLAGAGVVTLARLRLKNLP